MLLNVRIKASGEFWKISRHILEKVKNKGSDLNNSLAKKKMFIFLFLRRCQVRQLADTDRSELSETCQIRQLAGRLA